MYFQIYTDQSGYWRWRLVAGNHEIIAHGESYTRRDNCLKAVQLVKGSGTAPVYEV